MPKFIYTGTHRDNPDRNDGNSSGSQLAFGIVFPRGVPVEVTDAHAVRKLTHNSFFRCVPDEQAPIATVTLPAGAVERVQIEVDAGASWEEDEATQPPAAAAPRKSRRK